MRKLLLILVVAAGMLFAVARLSGRPSQTAQSPAGKKRIIYPPEFRPNMNFSPGVQVGRALYVAGQVGNDLKTGKIAPTFEGEVRQTLDNVGVILKAAGMDYANVVNVNVYLTDISKFDEMNKVYREYFKADRPARATVQVAKLVGTAQIEIAAIAHE